MPKVVTLLVPAASLATVAIVALCTHEPAAPVAPQRESVIQPMPAPHFAEPPQHITHFAKPPPMPAPHRTPQPAAVA